MDTVNKEVQGCDTCHHSSLRSVANIQPVGDFGSQNNLVLDT